MLVWNTFVFTSSTGNLIQGENIQGVPQNMEVAFDR